MLLCTLLIGCNSSGEMQEVRDKFPMRRTDLEKLRTMAEKDNLVYLHVEEERRINPATISPNRIAEYRSTLKRFGGRLITRNPEENWSWIAIAEFGWPVTVSVCGYLFVPNGAIGQARTLRGAHVIVLDTEWFIECHDRK